MYLYRWWQHIKIKNIFFFEVCESGGRGIHQCVEHEKVQQNRTFSYVIFFMNVNAKTLL